MNTRLALAALLLLGCKPKDPATPPEADTDTDADADADTDTDTDADADGVSPELGTHGCDELGFWRVSSAAGAVIARVDTVSAETTFDPALELWSVADWMGNDPDLIEAAIDFENDGLGFGDDEFSCTFPPTDFECPIAQGTVDGSDFLAVVVPFGNCESFDVSYMLTVEVDGAPANLVYIGSTTAAGK